MKRGDRGEKIRFYPRPVVAVLSTAVMPKDGMYIIETLPTNNLSLDGIPHYVGHTYTRKIVESLGAVPSRTRSFRGLRIGESAICCPIRRNKREHKYTQINQKVNINDLCFRILTRLR